MASWIKRAVVLGFVCGVGGVVGSACADNNSTIFIRQVQGPTAGQCTYTADPSALALGVGVLDVMLASQYRAALLVGNQMVQRGQPDMAKAETSRVSLTEAEVRVEDSAGNEIKSFTVPGNGFVDPGSGTTPGWGVFMTILIDPATSKVIGDTYFKDKSQRSSGVLRTVAVVKVFGQTLGGTDVESGEFRFPIEVCYGCLVSFPPERTDPTYLPTPNCQKCTDSTATEPCLFGQDAWVDCCACKGILGAAGEVLCEL